MISFNNFLWFCNLLGQSNRTWKMNELIYIQMLEYGEIAFLCRIWNVIVHKFDLVVASHIGQWRKSHGHNDRPTHSTFFPEHPVFHFVPPRSIFSRYPLKVGAITDLNGLGGIFGANFLTRAHMYEVYKPVPYYAVYKPNLTQWGLVTPYGDRDLGQHWLR